MGLGVGGGGGRERRTPTLELAADCKYVANGKLVEKSIVCIIGIAKGGEWSLDTYRNMSIGHRPLSASWVDQRPSAIHAQKKAAIQNIE